MFAFQLPKVILRLLDLEMFNGDHALAVKEQFDNRDRLRVKCDYHTWKIKDSFMLFCDHTRGKPTAHPMLSTL